MTHRIDESPDAALTSFNHQIRLRRVVAALYRMHQADATDELMPHMRAPCGAASRRTPAWWNAPFLQAASSATTVRCAGTSGAPAGMRSQQGGKDCWPRYRQRVITITFNGLNLARCLQVSSCP